jgi:bifunctional DNA-binding transcriptional regulator/antitoxin component of YhaV-PrlF toxin-antitoxin module
MALEVTGQGHLRLPALLRHRYGLQAGDSVFLAADTRARRLIIYPPAALDALTAPHREMMGGAVA